MKQEELLYNYYDTIEELQRYVDEYVEFFDNMRPHQRLEMLTPSVNEGIFAEKIKEHFGLSNKKSPKYPYSIKWWSILRLF